MTVQTYKNLGTIRKATKQETDGEGGYIYQHRFFGREHHALTLKDARECLEMDQAEAQRIREAMYTLKRHGYRIYRELDVRDFG